MKNKELNKRKFNFSLCATKKDQLIPDSQCQDLLDLINQWAREKDYSIRDVNLSGCIVKPVDVDSLLEDIDALLRIFNHHKANFPCVSDKAEGKQVLGTPDLYINQGYDNIIHKYPAPLTRDKIADINESGNWLNQNSLVRLYAVLDCHNALEKIDHDVEGAKHVELIRRLRNNFAHGSGKYDPSKKKHRDTMKTMHKVLGISIEGRVEWPLDIVTVLYRLFEGVKTYCRDRFGTHNIANSADAKISAAD